MERLLTVVVIAVALAAAFWFVVVLPYQMAERRRRQGWLYALLSVLLSPLIIVPLLYVMGGAPRPPH